MNKDNFEGAVRSAVGHGEKFVGAATDDKATEASGAYNDVAGKAQSAWGSAKDAAKEMADSRFDARPSPVCARTSQI